MGLFDDFEGDFESLPEPTIGLPEGTHECIVSQVAIEDKDSGKYLVITYTCCDETSPHKGRTYKEFKRIVEGKPQTQKDVEAMSYIRARLNDLGIPVSAMSSLVPDDLQGIRVALSLVPQKKDPSYRTVRSVKLITGGETVALPTATASTSVVDTPPSSTDNPFA